MAEVIVALAALAVLAAMSFAASRRFAGETRLPMQWGLDGGVNWTAPRVVALAFTPLLASLVLTAMVISSWLWSPEELVVPVMLFNAGLFVAVHALHLWLMDRTVRRSGR